MKLINDFLIKELESIMGLCFVGNRIMDRIKSQLGVKFVMKNIAKYIHDMAHQMPLLADQIGDYLESRNHDEGYLETISDFTDYINSRECFDKILKYFIDLESVISSVIDNASDDKTTKKFLNNFLNDVKDYTEKALFLVDLSEQYGCDPKDNMQFDSNIVGLLSAGD